MYTIYIIEVEDISALLHLFQHDATMVRGEANTNGAIPADPGDGQELACALDGEANFIVSDNQHMLNLRIYQNIPVITSQNLLKELL